MEHSYDKDHSKKPNKTDYSDHNPEKNKQHHPPPSSSELLSSAKIVANAAKAQFQHDPNYKFDKAQVAGAAENILNAASHYGKLDEKGGGLGKMVDQAGNYLHKYHSSQSTTTSTTNPDHSTTTTTTHSSETVHTKPHKEEHGGSGGGYGDYLKMAEGLMNKHSGSGTTGEGGHSGGKYGDYVKMAEGFLKK